MLVIELNNLECYTFVNEIIEEAKEAELNEFGNPVGTRELKKEQPKSNKNKKHGKK